MKHPIRFSLILLHRARRSEVCACTFMDKCMWTSRGLGTEKYSYLYMALLCGTANKCKYSKIYGRTHMLSKIKAQTDWNISR